VIAVDRLGYLIESRPREHQSRTLAASDQQRLAEGLAPLADAALTGSIPPPIDLSPIEAQTAIATEITELRPALVATASSSGAVESDSGGART
jgi:hypothetical protein